MDGVMWLPGCPDCENGTLVPLSDYGEHGSSVLFKAWACTSPTCGFQLRVDKGKVSYSVVEGKRERTAGAARAGRR